MPEKVAFVRVAITQREGFFVAKSDDVHGLYVIGKDRAAVMQDVGPMIERLYEVNKGIAVKAALAADPSFGEPSSENGFMHYYAAKMAQQVAA